MAFQKDCVPWNKGKKFDSDKITWGFKKGNIVNLGKTKSEQAKTNMSNSKKGDMNPIWKGKYVEYPALHAWIRRNFDVPTRCEKCNKERKLDAANVSGKYERHRSNWKFLCRYCHMESDGRLQVFVNSKRNRK